jgi:hypothetical protein
MIEAAIIRVVDEIPLITMNEHKRVMELTIKQAKREVLLEAAEAMESGAFETPYGLRRMAEELT